MRLFLGYVLICLYFTGLSQNNNTPVIQKEDIPGIKILSEKEYTGTSLWGYINGGADLYLEYGFKNLTVQEIEYDNIHIKANIYKMSSDEAAFGIFSANVHKCEKRDLLKGFDCFGPYQYQAFKGNYYLSVISDVIKPGAEEISLKIGKSLLDEIKEPKELFPEFFLSNFKEYLGKLKFFNGRLGAQNIIPDWTDHFNGLNDYSVWLLPMDNAKIALVSFDNKGSRGLFLKNLENINKYWKLNKKDLILLNYSADSSDAEKYQVLIEDYLKSI